MAWWRQREIVVGQIELCPVILRARAILGIPDTSKRKSEFKIVDPKNKADLANPKTEPKLFLECDVARDYWGNGPKTMVIDIDENEVYKITNGSSYQTINGIRTWCSKQYLKHVAKPDLKPSDITNLESVLERVLSDKKNK